MDPAEEADICRVCRSEATPDKPLYHPCICIGSIKFVHQECLLQWLKHSRKEYCELCKHRFAFTPIYSPDMPSHLPVMDICMGLVSSIGTAIKFWFHFMLVAFGWLGVVPLTACRIYNCLFAGTVNAIIMMPFDMISSKNLLADCLQGCFVVACSVCSFIGLIWLREQLINGGAPQWLDPNQLPEAPNQPHGPAQANEVPGDDEALAAAGGEGAQHPAGPAADELAPANPHEAGNQEDQADLDFGEEEVNEEGGENADANNEGQDLNWNGMEWERAAEELTWQRMLGVDGSLIFIEHVLWVVSLNTLFILVFAFCPYHIGYFAVVGLGFEDYINASHFDGLITTILGYTVLAGSLLLCYEFASLVNFQRSRRMMGGCYVAVKVALLIVVEIGLFPLICGWWLDICSLGMFGATLKDRERGFYAAPRTIMFVHWLVGMGYVFYFTSFIVLTREVLRPGVLWFLRNVNEPDFNPIHEMVHQPIYKHLWRFLSSLVFFGSIILLMVWLPIGVIKAFFPTVLPYNVVLYSEAPVSELSMELLLLQVVLPALLEQAQARQGIKQAIHAWTFTIAHVLDLQSYLLGGFDRGYYLPFNPRQDRIHVMGEWRQIASLGGPIGFPLYHRPASFPLKIILLVVFLLVSMFLTSMIYFTLPVCIGRWLMSLWVGSTVVHEFYTAACGLYVYWLLVRGATALIFWMPLGYSFMHQAQEWAVSILKTLVVTVILAGIMPLLLGLLVELVVMAPLRVPLDQTPLFYCCQNWAMGLLHAKIIAAITLLGPNWWFKTIIEQIYANGFQNVDLHLNLRVLAVPLICILLLSLCVPYTISAGITILLGLQPEMQTLVERRVYPFMLTTVILGVILLAQIRKLKRLYDRIKNDKYLIGQQLVNYEHNADARAASL